MIRHRHSQDHTGPGRRAVLTSWFERRFSTSRVWQADGVAGRLEGVLPYVKEGHRLQRKRSVWGVVVPLSSSSSSGRCIVVKCYNGMIVLGQSALCS
jgi:hypothetical protein